MLISRKEETVDSRHGKLNLGEYRWANRSDFETGLKRPVYVRQVDMDG